MAYVAGDSFCVQTDVEALVGRGVFTSGTKPTAQQVLDWMARYGAQIESVLADNLITYTVPTRNSPFPASPTDPAVARLKTLCEAANAIAAAAKAIEMHEVKDSGSEPSQTEEMFKQFEAFLEKIAIEAVSTTTPSPTFSDTNTDGLTFLSTTKW